MAASDCEWAHSLLRGAHEQLGDRHVSVPGGLALAPRARAAQSHRVRLLGADAPAHRAVAAPCARMSSLSPEATWRRHLRQEPDAVMPLVRIRGGGYEQSSSLLRLEDMGAMESRHVLPAHLRRLTDGVHGALTLLGSLRVRLDDLVPALTVNLVGLDVHGEELDLVIGEAVKGFEWRQVATIDARHLRLEADQEPGRGFGERLVGHLVAPGGQRARGRELDRALHLGPAHATRLGEADEEIDVLHAGFLLDDVLQQEVTRVGVRTFRVDGGTPARELRDVLVVLGRPGAELRPRELALH